MFKNKTYKFSPDNLTFTETYKNNRERFLKILPFFTAGFIFCAAIVILLAFSFLTPNEKKLLREKEELQQKFILLDKKLNEFKNEIDDLSSRDDSLYRVILGKNPLEKSIRTAGTGGSSNKFIKLGSNNFKLVDSIFIKVDELNSKISILDYSYNDILETAKKNRKKLAHIPAIMPIYNKDLKGTGAGFGMRTHPILNIRRMHEGMDFPANKGTEVYATAEGIVADVRFSATFGKIVEINHGFGYETYYGHLSEFKVKKGQNIRRGEVIGLVGSTGLSSGMHLHYEVHLNGKEVNPVNYFYSDLTPAQYKQIIELSEKELYSMD